MRGYSGGCLIEQGVVTSLPTRCIFSAGQATSARLCPWISHVALGTSASDPWKFVCDTNLETQHWLNCHIRVGYNCYSNNSDMPWEHESGVICALLPK